MSATSVTVGSSNRACMIAGTAMMLAWTLGIGFVGLVLLLAIAYALVFHHPAVAVVCIFLLFTPLMLTVLWAVLGAAVAIGERWTAFQAVSGPTWWERRQPHRVLYQAYFL
ncbi:MAG: hypothetical protein LDL33_06215 [Desulfomonile sp.]|nr:hypothetical protein [Desulfomonile sp.]